MQVDFKGMMSSLTKTWAETPGAAPAGFNLAVVSDTYMNLHLRLGYHFNLVDASMDPEPHHNHIYFRFVGGVTDLTRRSRRAQFWPRFCPSTTSKWTSKGTWWWPGSCTCPRRICTSASGSWAGSSALPGNWIFS